MSHMITTKDDYLGRPLNDGEVVEEAIGMMCA